MATQNFVAFDHNDNRIMSVLAMNEQHAKAQVRDQLDRPGRRLILASWQKGGRTVKQTPNRVFLYSGGEHGLILPMKVILSGVRKAGVEMDSDESYLTTDEEIARHGGLQPDDTALVHPWNTEQNRWSYIEIDVDASDLEPVTGITA